MTALVMLRDGFGPICDQTCEPCMVKAAKFVCGCKCRACRDNSLTLQSKGKLPAGLDTLSAKNFELVIRASRRIAVKRGIVENRARARKGKPAKTAPGIGAEETAVAALRSLFNYAVRHGYVEGENPARDIDKPRRPGSTRRALADFELVELYDLTATGGDDSELDTLLVDYGLETGSRREGAYEFTMGQIKPLEQMLVIRDKYDQPVEVPVSADLIRRLLAHAIERGGAECDPTNPEFRPDAPVFWYKVRGSSSFAPITSRRFDTLHGRWQADLSWGAEIQVSYHFLRHTISETLKSHYGPHYAKRYLRHAENSVTDIYGKCTTEMLARAMSDLFGYDHPLAGGRESFSLVPLVRRTKGDA